MRRILSLILISAILISVLPTVSMAENAAPYCDDSVFSEAFELLTGIGCADITLRKDQPISRDAWLNLILEHSYYDGISKEELAMTGIYADTNYYFHPDESIELDDAVVMLVKLLGYMPGVEYHQSTYINIATKLDLDNGINASFSDYLDYETAYVLLYNYLIADLAEINISNDSVYVKNGSTNVLQQKYDITAVYGQITASHSYSLTSAGAMGEGALSLSGVSCKNDRYDSDKYFAKYVTAYVRDYEGSNEIVALVCDSRTKTVVIGDADSPSLSNNVIIYYDEDGKEKSERISRYAPVFCNGEEIVYDEAIIVPQTGTITLIENGEYSDGVDVVIVENTTDIKVASVSRGDKKVYAAAPNIGTYVFDDDAAITTADGMVIDASDITAGDVLTIWKKTDGSAWKAMLCTDKVTGTISEMSGDMVMLDNRSFTVSPHRKSAFADLLKPGIAVTASLNIYGQIADLNESSGDDALYGVLTRFMHKKTGLTESCIMELYTVKGVFSQYNVSEKAEINGYRCKTYDEVKSHLPKYASTDEIRQMLVMYKLDAGENIISIDYATDNVMDLQADSDLHLTHRIENSSTYSGQYKRYSKYIGNKIFVETASTLLFRYPKQGADGSVSTDVDLYSVNNLSKMGESAAYVGCTIAGYSTSKDSKVANYVTVEYDGSSGNTNSVGSDTRASMVGEKKKCIWRDENVEAITIYNSKNTKGITVYGKDENYFTNLGIDAGDIIRVDYLSQTMIAKGVELIWKNGATKLANGKYTSGTDASIFEARFVKVFKNWGVVSDVFLYNTNLAAASANDAAAMRTDLYSIFRYNAKTKKVETLTSRDLMAYDIVGNACSAIIYEMRYYDPISMFVVE